MFMRLENWLSPLSLDLDGTRAKGGETFVRQNSTKTSDRSHLGTAFVRGTGEIFAMDYVDTMN